MPFVVAILLLFAAVPAPASVRPTFASLMATIEKKKITKMETLLGELPKQYRRGYALVYDTKSRQGASPLSPRVIFHGDDAETLIAFNGEPEQENYLSLEMMEFADDEFVLHEIRFAKDGKGKPVPSEANPAECLDCHRRPSPRPNWETYPDWPGVYHSTSHPDPRGNTLFLSPDEEDNLYEFMFTIGDHPRYSLLEDLDKKYRDDGKGSYGDWLQSRPSTFLSHKLFKLNGRRIARLIRESPDYKKYKYAALGALMDCDWADRFVPASVTNEFPKSKWTIDDDTRALYRASTNEFERQRDGNTFLTITSSLRFLFENRGVPVDTWSMNFRGHRYGFVSPLAGYEYRGFAVLEPLLEKDVELAKAYREAIKAPGGACLALRKVSRAAFAPPVPSK